MLENYVDQVTKMMLGEHSEFAKVASKLDSIHSLSSSHALKALLESENRWQRELDKFSTPAILDFAKYRIPNEPWRDSLLAFTQGQTAVAALSDQMKNMKGYAAAITSVDDAFVEIAQKLGERLQGSSFKSFVENSYPESLLAPTRSYLKDIEKITASASTSACFAAAEELNRKFTEGFAERLNSSFNLAHLAADIGLTSALHKNAASFVEQYSSAFDSSANQAIKALAKGTQFDISTTFALAQLRGIEGLEKQFSALGIDFSDYSSFHGPAPTTYDDKTDKTTTASGLLRADDLRQILLNLIASLLWVTMFSSFVANPDMDQVNKRFEQLEHLVEHLPELVTPIVEQAIRRELGENHISFVVKERTAQLRSVPKAGSSVVAIVFPNQSLKLLDEQGKWIKVEFYDYVNQDIKEGWVLKKYCLRISKASRPD